MQLVICCTFNICNIRLQAILYTYNTIAYILEHIPYITRSVNWADLHMSFFISSHLLTSMTVNYINACSKMVLKHHYICLWCFNS